MENAIEMDEDWGYPYDSGNLHMESCTNIYRGGNPHKKQLVEVTPCRFILVDDSHIISLHHHEISTYIGDLGVNPSNYGCIYLE